MQDDTQGAIQHVVVPSAKDLGGFEVRRALPAIAKQMVGPFIFFDHFGPAEFLTGTGIDVRPHPHIGLSTVTYLIEGEILHRDSLGSVQPIRPGEVNLMTAGKGIVHSERTGAEVRAQGHRLYGLQTWLALPRELEETAPAFVHYGRDVMPVVEGEGKVVRLIAGSLFGTSSPVETATETIYADISLEDGARLPIAVDYEERCIYILHGIIESAGDRFEAGRMLILRPGDTLTATAEGAARVILLGGAAMDGPRQIWWNFVSSSKDRIEAAKADWREGRFEAVPGETEFIPLPENR